MNKFSKFHGYGANKNYPLNLVCKIMENLTKTIFYTDSANLDSDIFLEITERADRTFGHCCSISII